MSDAFVETGSFATSRGKPQADDVAFVFARLGKYPLSAIAQMSGRSLAFVQSVADMAVNPPVRVRQQVKLSKPTKKVPTPATAPLTRGQRQWRQSLPPTARQAIERVAKAHGLTYGDLTLPMVFRGPQSVCEVRQEAYHTVYAIRHPDGSRKFSLPQIGAWFGGRDHTTVRHGVIAHERRLAKKARAA